MVAPMGIVALYDPCAVERLDISGFPKGTRKSSIRSLYVSPYAGTQFVHSPIMIPMQSLNFPANQRSQQSSINGINWLMRFL